MSNWSFAASLPVLLAGLAIWLFAGWLCLTNWRRSGRRRSTAFLESLRFLLITLIAFTLLRPEFVRHIERTTTPEIAILYDGSGSMHTRDLLKNNEVISRAEWLAHQLDDRFWQSLESDARVILEPFSAPAAGSSSDLDGTDLSRPLETLLQRQRNLKAVLLLTDGDWNIGRSPVGAATQYRDRNIPVFTVAVGQETPLPDLILETLSPPSYGLFGEQVSIPFRVQSHLPREVATSLSLVDSRGVETTREIVIPAMGELRDAIIWSPRFVGDEQLTLRLPVESDEALAENNEESFRISVRVETLKVLVVDSLPRWEYRFLRNALERDPGVEMHSVLFHPGMAMGGGSGYLADFPGTKEALSRYDVIFLGDVGIGENELTEQDAELLKGLVEQQASGLVFLPGQRGRHLTLLNTVLRELYPVVLDETRPRGVGMQNESALLLSSMGRRHLLTRFDSDEDWNEQIWQQLPGFFWSAAVEKSRPGSEVLAVHSSLRNSWGRLPLLVTRPAGNGKVLFMGTDSAWRWRRGVEDKFHYRFWSQVVRWMAHQRHLAAREGIRVSFSPETPEAGDTVFLQTTILDASGFPIQEGPVSGRIVSPSGRSERLQFAPLAGGWGVFTADFSPEEGGDYQLEVASLRHGRQLETVLPVNQPVLEKIGQPVNAQILREISTLTRGLSASYAQLGEVIEQISLLPEPEPVERRVRLWTEPWWGGFILLLLGIYWAGRKVAGMI